MPRPNNGPRIVLYGPDSRHGAKPRAGFHHYVWYVVWSERGKKHERSTGTGDRATALDALASIASDLKRSAARAAGREPRPLAPEDVVIGDVLACYGEERGTMVADPVRVGVAIAKLTPFWGHRTVAEITLSSVREYARVRREDFARSEAERIARAQATGRAFQPLRTLSDATLRRELVCLRAAMNHAHRSARILATVPHVEMPPDGSPRDVFLTRSQVARLVRAARRSPRARGHLPRYILVAFYTGARRTAILRLRWSEHREGGGWVDIERGVINFQGHDAITRKRRPHIPIPDRLLTLFRFARARTTTHVLEFEGRPIQDVKTALATAARDAGLGCVFSHILKHSVLTYLLQAGVPIWAVSGWTGTSIATIERVYGHPAHEKLGHVREALRRTPPKSSTRTG